MISVFFCDFSNILNLNVIIFYYYKDGYVDIPKKSGLGIEIDEQFVEKIALEGLVWTNAKWKNYDGTIAEW